MSEQKYPLVMVKWLDSQGGSHWEFEKDLNPDYELPVVKTYGVVVRDTRDWILIASSFMAQELPLSNQLHSTMTIPKCSILSIINLVEGGLYVREG